MRLTAAEIPKRTLTALEKKHIYTTDDLVRWLPRKYRDYRKITPVTSCVPEQYYAIRGTLRLLDKRSGQRQYMLLKVEPETDDYTTAHRYVNVTFFSRMFLYQKYYSYIGSKIVICGKVSYDPQYGYSMTEPDELTLASAFEPGIRTIYPKVGGVSDDKLREMIDDALDRVTEPLDWELMQDALVETDYRTALLKCHRPETAADLRIGRRRIDYNDMLYFALCIRKLQGNLPDSTIMTFRRTQEAGCFLAGLPFELTADQQAVIDKITEKSGTGKRINILLQGDVGSGKTVVALYAMMLAADNGFQAVLMAPREVLARQHYETFVSLTGKTDETVYLHSGMKAKERKEALKAVRDGKAKYIIGTHSCVSDDVIYHKLGLVVTDEEHLFGVDQKEKIVRKAEEGVHQISMSATPIPRTLASVLYGDKKEVEAIKTMPKGRLPIMSCIIDRRERAFPHMLKQIRAGRQCYVVAPAIEDNDDIEIVSIESIEQEYRDFFEPRGVKIVVANGKMDKKAAEESVRSFAEGEAQILISTTVIEVGVNVPNASTILIEQADRFGLASLHQLRGRVGRGIHQSYCILRSDDLENPRLKTLCSTTDGFVIAEEDMKQRGTGNLLGVEQSGANRYIDLVLSNPSVYQQVQEQAEYAFTLGLGEKLISMYREHEIAEEES